MLPYAFVWALHIYMGKNVLPYAFVWALHIYMGKMLRTHILDISSKDYDLNELKLDEEHRGA